MPAVDLFKDCPGYADAVRREDELRSLPFLGLPERVAGVDCAPLTLRRRQWLEMANSPFLGSYPAEAIAEHPQLKYHLRLFFWTAAPEFKPGAKWRQRFYLRRVYKKLPRDKSGGHDLLKIIAEIQTYFQNAWMDAPTGEKSRSFFSSAASIAGFFHHNFGLEIDCWNDSPLRNFMRRLTGRPSPLDIPLRIVWQLQRVHVASKSDTSFTNRLSDPTWKTWLAAMNKSVKRN